MVLTAAHCIRPRESFERKAANATFHIGRHSLDRNEGHVVSRVTKFVVHPEWNQTVEHSDADVALALLSKKIQFTQFIRPICLGLSSPTYYDLIDNVGTVAGNS